MLVQNIRDNDEMQTLYIYIYINDASDWSSVEPVLWVSSLVHNCT